MKPNLTWSGLAACCVAAACTQPEPGIPMEFSKACALENEKKVVEMNGFLSAAGSVFCSNRGGRMECGFKFTESPGAAKSISAYIEQGSGANTVDKLKSGYKREDVRSVTTPATSSTSPTRSS